MRRIFSPSILIALCLTTVACQTTHKNRTSPVASTAVVQSKLNSLSDQLGSAQASNQDVKKLADEVIQSLNTLVISQPIPNKP